MNFLSDQDSFVFYQLPDSNEILFINGNWKTIDLTSDINSKGFIISTANKTATYLLEGKAISISNNFDIVNNQTSPELNNINKSDYLIKASQFILACKKQLKKVIFSRIKKHCRNQNQNAFDTFKKICNTYNHSFNYLLNIPETGMWMGASPEILISGTNNQYITVSLAGTKSILEKGDWQQKEIEEQQFVTEYISNKLTSHNISNDYNSTTETVTAGNLSHLKTTFHIHSNKSAIEIADLLHPTPAVCGIPEEKAQQFIHENEGYKRDFYTGFLGPIDIEASNLYVNLRCMQIFQNEYWLYVGGGITANSIAEKEWEETELKAKTLLNILE